MTTIKSLSLSSIVSVNAEDINVSLVKSVENEVINFGGLKIRTWDNNSGLHVIFAGESGKGKEAIELEGYEAVAGLLNAAMLLKDNPGMFSVLNLNAHIYSDAAKRSYAKAAGYVRVMIADKNNAGLEKAMWKGVRKSNGGYESAGLVQSVSYSQSRTWKTEEARKDNEHARHIVNLHNGINAILQIAAGTHFASFKTFDWSEKSKSALASKIFAMKSTPEFRASQKEDAATRKNFGVVSKQAQKAASAGNFRASSSGSVTYRNAMNIEVTGEIKDLIGKTWEICKSNGSPLAYRFGINNAEEGATKVALARSISGYLQEVE